MEQVQGPVLEWFRSGVRRAVLRAVLPAMLVATLGWALLMIAHRQVEGRWPMEGPRGRSTFAAPAVVDVDGRPLPRAQPTLGEWAMAAAGGLLALCSPVVLALGLLARGRPDDQLLLRTGGLSYRRGGEAFEVPWSELEEVRLDSATGAPRVLLGMHDGRELALEGPFDGVGLEELTRRIRQVRNQALFGLLPASQYPERSR